MGEIGVNRREVFAAIPLQSVGTFVDDVYHGRSRTSEADLFDLPLHAGEHPQTPAVPSGVPLSCQRPPAHNS